LPDPVKQKPAPNARYAAIAANRPLSAGFFYFLRLYVLIDGITLLIHPFHVDPDGIGSAAAAVVIAMLRIAGIQGVSDQGTRTHYALVVELPGQIVVAVDATLKKRIKILLQKVHVQRIL
jgi:hypothetical protein